jgi:two-component system response regulator CpxR
LKYSRLISKYLSVHGYKVTVAGDGRAGLEAGLKQRWHAIMLDIMLPGIDGYEVLRAIRERSGVPIIMLTAVSEETDRIVGLELGADDYIPKSFSPREILARLRAVLRRFQRADASAPADGADVVVGPLAIQIASRSVKLNGQLLKLTAIEFDLLLALAQAKGRIKTREQLLNDLTSANSESCDRSIDVHISMLRRKLNDDAKNPCLIRTIRSVGYSMPDPNEVPN